MCNWSSQQVPWGWKRKCQRALLPPGSSTPCSLFLSPNGRTFRTMEEVEMYTRQLEQQKIEGEHKKMEEKMLMLNMTDMEVNNYGNSSALACSSCSKIFVSGNMVKKHREEHIQQQINRLKPKMSTFECNQYEHTNSNQIEKTLPVKNFHVGTKCHLCGNKYSSEIKLELHLQLVHRKDIIKKAPSVLIGATSLPASRDLPLSQKYMRTSLRPSLPTLTSSLPSMLPCLPPLPSNLHPPCCPPCPAPRTTQTGCTADWPVRDIQIWRKIWSLPAPPSKEQKDGPVMEADLLA